MIANYIFVSLTLILAIFVVSLIFKQIRQEQEEAVRQEN